MNKIEKINKKIKALEKKRDKGIQTPEKVFGFITFGLAYSFVFALAVFMFCFLVNGIEYLLALAGMNQIAAGTASCVIVGAIISLLVLKNVKITPNRNYYTLKIQKLILKRNGLSKKLAEA